MILKINLRKTNIQRSKCTVAHPGGIGSYTHNNKMESGNINFPGVDFEVPGASGQPPIDDSLREKLISLAEKGKINYSPKYIQKASRDVLEKIKIKCDRKISEKSSKIISDLIVSKLSDLLEKTDLIESSPELKQELNENE